MVITTAGIGSPRRVTFLEFYRVIYIQVIGSVDIRISNEEDTLKQGYGLTISSGDGISKFVWRGSLWVDGDIGGKANVEEV